jgi:hypothetical protein
MSNAAVNSHQLGTMMLQQEAKKGKTAMKARSLTPRRTLLASSDMLANVAQAQDSTFLEKRVQIKSLNNGRTLLVFERRESPSFLFSRMWTSVRAGEMFRACRPRPHSIRVAALVAQ